ncbi:MAG: PDZ domain-containing protein [Alphaproteobacteria bacterium]|nr:PDZ domain-containing protein [Alphaproteobacteria bacterium]MBT5861101.1 PDZ domain-containing protein [Alphaproteobacteria bacterium]
MIAAVFAAAFAMLAVSAAPAMAQARVAPQTIAEAQISFGPIVARVAPAVVDIETVGAAPGRSVYFPGRPPGNSRNVVSAASGVIVRADGWIVTATHVVLGAESIIVELADTRRFGAEVVLIDHRAGLAILRINVGAEALPFVPIGDSDLIQVGDLALAFGNPFGIGQTVSMGIVSALSRTLSEVSNFQSFIQTDASLNPGSSGGPLVAADGTLAGINTVIFSRTGDSVGIGLAIPSNMVSQVLDAAIDGFLTIRPWIGARLSWPDTTHPALADGTPRERGAVVDDLFPGGPGDRAGLLPGDRITALNGRAVADPIDLTFRVASLTIGDTVQMLAMRDGAEVAITFPLDALPGSPESGYARAPNKLLNGILLGDLFPALADALGLHPMDKGVVVLEFQGLGTSGRPRLEIGDILVKINDHVINVVQQVADSVVEVRRDWKITVRRGGTDVIFDVFL